MLWHRRLAADMTVNDVMATTGGVGCYIYELTCLRTSLLALPAREVRAVARPGLGYLNFDAYVTGTPPCCPSPLSPKEESDF
jgi:hypothetical protein